MDLTSSVIIFNNECLCLDMTRICCCSYTICWCQCPKTLMEALTVQLSYLNRWAFFLLAALLSHNRHRHSHSSGHVHKNTHRGKGWRQEKIGKTHVQDADASTEVSSETQWWGEKKADTGWSYVNLVLAAAQQNTAGEESQHKKQHRHAK